MNKKPDLTISTLDLDRIYDLIESLPHNNAADLELLEEELNRANALPPEQMPPNVVTMNSTVKFYVASTDKELELTLVYPKDMDTSGKKISILAPAGSALIGLSVGDEIEWPKPTGGSLKVKITEVLYQPERAGDFRS
ncbi:nucleoside diphosphate kinase regulator [Pseudoalteromonas sp. YIC-827]|uniref:Nucleoside diphosphate kinase regulator n=1 Tax=Pseudoalteromonas qingdaonensis TaxID=3131913 RepID=A0ABU9N178_9GAMM